MEKHCATCELVILKKSKQWKNQKYCSNKCRKLYHRKRISIANRVEQKKSNLLQNEEMLYLIRQCKKAKTVEILHGHTLDTFIETMNLIRHRPPGDVNLCHISPVKGKTSIGLMHCHNLFYGGAYQNKKLSNTYLSGGLSIERKKLKKRWEVDPSMSNNEVLVLIEQFLCDIMPDYLRIAPVRKSKKVNLALKIVETNPSKNFDVLIHWSYKKLQEEWKATSGQPCFIFDPSTESKYLTYVDEMTRFISYGGERTKLLKQIRKLLVIGYLALDRVKKSETYNKFFYVKHEPLIDIKYGQAMLKNPDHWSEFKDLMYDTAFYVMQGGQIEIAHFKKKMMGYLKFPKRAKTIF
nr:hypothetical protein [Pseudomonas mosselii]